jgi:flavodoxin
MGKKVLIIILVILVIALIGGGVYYFSTNNEADTTNQVAESNNEDRVVTNTSENIQNTIDNTENQGGNILIAYYSYTGNTEEFANAIRDEVGGTLFEIQRAEDYSDLYTEAENEINNNEKPALKEMPENVDQYDTIFVGYPIWWDRAPAMINTFLSNINLEGKTVIPFCTSSSDGIEGSMTDIRNSAGDATILDGLRISGGSAENSRSTIQAWLEEIGIKE